MLNLNGAIDNYLLACRAEGKSPKTLRSYGDVLREFSRKTGEVLVSELQADHVRMYMADLSARAGKYGTFSTHSSMKHYQVIRTFVRWMYSQKFIQERITDYTKAPRLSKDLPAAMTEEQVERLLRYLKEKPFRDLVIFELFLDTGLRLAEVSNLDLHDVHIEACWLRVYGKGKVEDHVPFGRKMARDLHTYVNVYRHAPETEKAFFINRDGYRLEREGLSMLVKRALSDIGIEGKHGAHILRHTFATMFLRKGGSLEALRRILRHTDVGTTQRYTHLLMEDVQEAHRKASPLDGLSR